MKRQGNWVILVMIWACGCGNSLTPNAYKEWVEDPVNGYSKRVFNDEAEVFFLFQPRDYAAANLYFNSSGAYKSLSDARKELGENSFFSLKVAVNDSRLANMSSFIFYELEKDIRLIVKNDTIYPSYYLAEPYDGVQPYQHIIIGFPLVLDKKKDITFLMDSNIIFYQPISISFANRNIRLPRIKI